MQRINSHHWGIWCVESATVALLLAISACSPTTTPIDGGLDSDSVDAVAAPDLDLPDADSDAGGQIGTRCESNQDCANSARCLKLTESVGLCAAPNCTAEDPGTPERDDSCPEGTACSQIDAAVSPTGRYCLPICTPAATENSCDRLNSAIACDPISIQLTGYIEVCATLACENDLDCAASPGDTCDTQTGVCFNDSTSTAAVGQSCSSDAACRSNQRCIREFANLFSFRGGYCTIVGCRFAGRWTCPAASGCYRVGGTFAPSLCLATGCDPAMPIETDGCRDGASVGTYDCVLISGEGVCWSNL